MNPKMLAGIVLIMIGAIGLLTGGFKAAIANKTAESAMTQSVRPNSGLDTTRGILTGACLLGGVGLVVAGAIKK